MGSIKGVGDKHMSKMFDVQFEIAPSQGGQERVVSVQADGVSAAVLAAALKLDEEGIDRWSLRKVTESTS